MLPHPFDVAGRRPDRVPAVVPAVVLMLLAAGGMALAQAPVTPQFAQPGKDVVWVPSPLETVALMLDLAEVTSQDHVFDLGSGDGRTVIAAAQRGARAVGVEYNGDLVAFSRHEALRAGVADRATFVQGDMYEADVSQATVLALFLLTENLRELSPTFLALRPGTRIVSNTFAIPGWTPVRTARRDDSCTAWCEALLYVVPAQVAGTWQVDGATLEFAQVAQTVSGTLGVGSGITELRDVSIDGDQLAFAVGETRYEGHVKDAVIEGERRDASGVRTRWRAVRVGADP